MTKLNKSRKDQKEWDEVLRRVVGHMGTSDLRSALVELDAFLESDITAQVRSGALGFRAEVKQELGDLDSAEHDLHEAISLVGPSYSRYVHELGLAGIYKRRGQPDVAASFYLDALRTCVAGKGISCGTALAGLLELKPEALLSDDDKRLCLEAVKRAWSLLRLPGDPDRLHLDEAALSIKSAEARPRPRR
jgi:hypothetical protein